MISERFNFRQKYVIEKAAQDVLSGEVTTFHKDSEQLVYNLVRDWFSDKLTGELDVLLKAFKG